MSEVDTCIDCGKFSDETSERYLTEEGTICGRCFDKRIREMFRILNQVAILIPDSIEVKDNFEEEVT